MRRALRRRLVERGKLILHAVFVAGQRLGVNLLPRHAFYSEVPDIRALKAGRWWRKPYSMVGVGGTDLDEQVAWLETTCPPELAAKLHSLDLYARAAEANGDPGFGVVEMDILYCLVQTRKPRRMIQIGAGAATWSFLQAASDAGQEVEVMCVDPYPTPLLKRLSKEGRIHLEARPVQEVPPERLVRLSPGDVLFVDSTHTLSPGSDVNHIILEVLPRLQQGVLVHFHDVTMPFDYFPYLLTRDLFFWRESVLLHAYLADNPRFRIRLGCAMLAHAATERFQSIVPTYDPALPMEDGLAERHAEGLYPSSLWLEVVAPPSAPTQ